MALLLWNTAKSSKRWNTKRPYPLATPLLDVEPRKVRIHSWEILYRRIVTNIQKVGIAQASIILGYIRKMW